MVSHSHGLVLGTSHEEICKNRIYKINIDEGIQNTDRKWHKENKADNSRFKKHATLPKNIYIVKPCKNRLNAMSLSLCMISLSSNDKFMLCPFLFGSNAEKLYTIDRLE